MITSKKSAQAVNAGEQGVRVATYTEKSFCVFGDTYPLRKMLKAAKLCGIESQGMLLCACTDDDLCLVTPEKKMPSGATVR